MDPKLTNQEKKHVDKEVKKQLKSSEKVLEKKLEKKIEAKLHKRLLRKSVKTTVYLGSQFKDHATTAIIAAFSFLIALVWKDFIVKLVKENTEIASIQSYPYLPELVTALIVTIIAVVGIALVGNWAKKPDK